MVDIIQAVIAGDLAGVQSALASGVSPNTIGQDSLSLLHYAAGANQPAIFSLLVSHGAAINAKDTHNNEPLFYAARGNGSKSFVDFIIASGADINNASKIGETALHLAARLDSLGALESMIINGANANIKDIIGRTPLHDAVVTNHPDVILLLIEFGASLHIKDNYGHTPIDNAQTANQTVQQILAMPILDSIQLPAHNALLQAAVINDVHGVKDAIAHGVSVNTTNSHGLTGLHFAALHGYSDMIQEFINDGAYINQTTVDGLQPLHLAAMAQQINVIDTLVNAHAAINAVDYLGNTALHYAVQNGGSTDLVTKILDAGAWIDTVNKHGETALHLAAEAGNVDAVKVLVAHHANLTIQDAKGETAADEAISSNHLDIATFLKQQNADHSSTTLHQISSNKEFSKPDIIKINDVISEKSAIDVLCESGPVQVNNSSQIQATSFVQESVLPVVMVEVVM